MVGRFVRYGSEEIRGSCRLDYTVADRVVNQLDDRISVQFLHHRSAMRFYGSDADAERLRDVFIALVFGQ